MSEKIIDLLLGTAMPLTGVTPVVKLQSRFAQDAIAPSTTKGSDKGDTPYRQMVLRSVASAGTYALLTVGRPNPRMAGVGPQAQYAQSIACDGVNHEFTSKFDYDDAANHNWIAELNGKVLVQDDTPDATLDQFDIVDDGGKAQVVIGDGTLIPQGEIALIKASSLVKTLLSDAANADVEKVVNPGDYVYILGDAAEISKAVLAPYYR